MVISNGISVGERASSPGWNGEANEEENGAKADALNAGRYEIFGMAWHFAVGAGLVPAPMAIWHHQTFSTVSSLQQPDKVKPFLAHLARIFDAPQD